MNSEVKQEYAVDVEKLNIVFHTDDATVYAVNSIDLKLKKGTIKGLVGETGAGKTTSMLALMKLVPKPGIIKTDRLVINGKDINNMSSEGT